MADTEWWCIQGVTDAARFFRAIAEFLPEATHLYLEGAPTKEIAALLTLHATEGSYRAPIGTLSQKFVITCICTVMRNPCCKGSTRSATRSLSQGM